LEPISDDSALLTSLAEKVYSGKGIFSDPQTDKYYEYSQRKANVEYEKHHHYNEEGISHYEEEEE
jgi:hypothetical protein